MFISQREAGGSRCLCCRLMEYVNPFHPENRHQFKLYSVGDSGSPEEVRRTIYAGTQPEHLPQILNLHLDAVVDAHRTIAELPEIHPRTIKRHRPGSEFQLIV